MTNQELNEAVNNPSKLNELVARKLGWVRCDEDEKDETFWHDTRTVCTNALPAYSTSIEAAWEIVDHLTDKMFQLNHVDEIWICAFENRTYKGEPDEWVEKANIAPMAICQAFLKLP